MAEVVPDAGVGASETHPRGIHSQVTEDSETRITVEFMEQEYDNVGVTKMRRSSALSCMGCFTAPDAITFLRLLLVTPAPAYTIWVGVVALNPMMHAQWYGASWELLSTFQFGMMVWMVSSPMACFSISLSLVGKSHTDRVWTPFTFLETIFLFLLSLNIYFPMINSAGWGYLFVFFTGNTFFILIWRAFTRIIKTTRRHWDTNYEGFTRDQAVWLVKLMAISAFFSLYALSGMLRMPLPRELAPNMIAASLDGVSCADREAFFLALDEPGANVSFLGYTSFDALCQAVQYAPMSDAVGNDAVGICMFNFAAYLLRQYLIGTGRVRADDGYAGLRSPPLLMAIGVMILQALCAFVMMLRVIQIVPMLLAPRPASFFVTAEVMSHERPSWCYGDCNETRFWLATLLNLVVLVLVNFDSIKSYAAAKFSKLVTKEEFAILEKALQERQKREDDEKANRRSALNHIGGRNRCRSSFPTSPQSRESSPSSPRRIAALATSAISIAIGAHNHPETEKLHSAKHTEATEGDEGGSRFTANSLVMGQPAEAALGVPHLINEIPEVLYQKVSGGVQAIVKEITDHCDDIDRECLQYVLYEEAGSSDKLFENSPFPRDCDANGRRQDRTINGRGMILQDFVEQTESRTARLSPEQ